MRSLNGCRVNDTVLTLVPDVNAFRTALRALKKWVKVCVYVRSYAGCARRPLIRVLRALLSRARMTCVQVRGLYSNKMGYLGGVNLVILVAFVCQLFPRACGGTVLIKFFKVFNQVCLASFGVALRAYLGVFRHRNN